MIVAVATRYCRGQRGVGSVDLVDELTESGPFVETEGHASLGRVVGLVELSQIEACVAGGYTYVVASPGQKMWGGHAWQAHGARAYNGV